MTQVEITDADREAAAAVDDALGYMKVNRQALIQAFAHHRQAADRAGYDRGVRESAGVAEAWGYYSPPPEQIGVEPLEGLYFYGNTVDNRRGNEQAIATQILALIPGTGAEDA